MNRGMRLFALLAWLGCAFELGADESPPMVSLKRLSVETALKIAQAAMAECRGKGIQIGVTLVDRDGVVQAQLRDSIAAPITLSISQQKAYTAANFNAATSALKDRAESPLGRVPGLLMHPGGLPIQVGGQLLGGIGVSGASGETDEECARVGIKAVIEDLEMAQ